MNLSLFPYQTHAGSDSTKHASEAFEVPETTLRRRRDGKFAQGDSVPNSKKLKETKEEAMIACITELDLGKQALHGLWWKKWPTIYLLRAVKDLSASTEEIGSRRVPRRLSFDTAVHTIFNELRTKMYAL